MIFDMNPVSDIQSVSIDGERLVPERLQDHERNQFFRELIRPIVIRTTSHDDILAKSFMGCQNQEISRRLARRIRRTRVKEAFFRKSVPLSERAIYFVSGNLDKPLDAMASGDIQQATRPDDIRVNEVFGRRDT